MGGGSLHRRWLRESKKQREKTTDLPGFDFPYLHLEDYCSCLLHVANIRLGRVPQSQGLGVAVSLKFPLSLGESPGDTDGFQKPSSCFLAAVRGTMRARLKGQVSRKAGPLHRALAPSTLWYCNNKKALSGCAMA